MEEIVQNVVRRAEALLTAAQAAQTSQEKAEAAKLARLMDDPSGKAFTLEMVDRVFRSQLPALQASRLRDVLQRNGTPRYLGAKDRFLLKTGAAASALVPGIVMNAVSRQLRQDSARVVLPGEAAPLDAYLQSRRASGVRVNVNHLGEAILGEAEAAHRMDAVLGHLANPAIDYVSVKISAIFSQINVVDWCGTVDAICERLRRLYRAALPAKKFVNLDMEEYRDLGLTLAAFRRTLDDPEFHSLRAGIVLQAYLPDSFAALQELAAWAKRRVASGGATIKVRLVKGANLAMEKVEAELHGWNFAPYPTKADTDANFRRMLEFATRPENAAVVQVGVASHNLFDVALALELRERNRVADRVEIEMLEGMASHQARAVHKAAGGLLVYAPLVKQADFNSAMAYLVRRLDENTSPENFLHDLFAIAPGSPAWERQMTRFIQGWSARSETSAVSRRASLPPAPDGSFHNAADTDWTQLRHREALHQALAAWKPVAVPAAGVLETVLKIAGAAQPAWWNRGWDDRATILRQCADGLEAGRFETIAILMRDGKKAAWEADAEISEAIDFARYYAAYRPAPTLVTEPLGTVVITPPWNFPYAIPCGGLLAALMAGNSVILKPAPETAATGLRLAQQLWEVGVPRDVLQFFPCPDGDTGKQLITNTRVSAVVLTGGYETARLFQGWRPSLRLFAETSGKNALVVTAQADRDLTIKDLVKSAFGHAGQKCSAASLGILEAEVYDDPAFRRQLRDAAASLPVGPATKLSSVVTPLIREPSPNLKRALTTLDEGEEWLLEPKCSPDDPCLWSPGIKLGVRPESWFHLTECFGPVLGLMRAADLDDAIRLQNAPDYGLTGGIHSLDDAEISHWKERVLVGNAYINRAITGAIVQRQPFGGWKRSSIGPGSKAGGPDYVGLFLNVSPSKPFGPAEVAEEWRSVWASHFQAEHDPSALACEANVIRHRPAGGVILRVAAEDEHSAALARLASEITGVRLTVSSATVESDEALAARLADLAANHEFFRTVGPVGDGLLAAVHAAGLNWVCAPFVADGRTELARWSREQSVSTTRHRYGLIASKHN